MRRGAFTAAVVMVATLGVVAIAGGDRSSDDELVGYRIDYDVEVFLDGGRESTRREVRVQRPFSGLDLRHDIEGVSGTISDNGRFTTVQPGAVFDGGEGAPGLPPGDVRFDAVLDDLERLGLLERREDDTVVGRRCTTYRSGAPLGDPLRPASPDEFVDWCIDDAGFLLAERWHLDGELLRATTATAVQVAPQPRSAFAPPAGPRAEPHPVGRATRIELPTDEAPDAGAAGYWAATSGAAGFTLDTRWRVVTSSTSTGVPEVRDVAFADVYVRGTDFVVVQHREAARAGDPVPGIEQVDAGELGRAEVHVSPQGTELQVVAGAWLVSVRATLGVSDVAAFAAELQPVSDR